MTLGQRIQMLRKNHELSQEGLGEKLGVSRQAISRWEMDGAVPEVDKLIAMSKLFGVTLGQLLGVEEPKETQTPARRASGSKWLRRGMAALAILCLVLSAAVGLLWHDIRLLRQTPAAEDLVEVWSEQPLLEYAVCELSDIELGFPLAQGTEDLNIHLELKPVQEMKGWQLLGVDIEISGIDPWGHSPQSYWTETKKAAASKTLFGPYQIDFTLSEYGGETLAMSAVFQHKETGQVVRLEELFMIKSNFSKWTNFAVEDIEVSKPRLAGAFIPGFLEKALPVPGFEAR